MFGFILVAESEIIEKNYFTCCGKESCFEKAMTSVSVRTFYKIIPNRPAMFVTDICIPNCGNPIRANAVRRQSDSLMKSKGKECRKLVIQDYLLGTINCVIRVGTRAAVKASTRSAPGVTLHFIARRNASLKTGRIMNKTVFEMSFRYGVFYYAIFYNS